MSAILQFMRTWTLPIAMCMGVALYFLYTSIPWLDATHAFVSEAIAIIQPTLLFLMLFLTFCRVDLHDIRLRRWHLILVAIQMLFFGLTAGVLILLPDLASRVLVESALLCLMCPTATAAAVVTAKLGGNAASITGYTMLINLAVALSAPLLLPLAHPTDGLHFLPAFGAILARIFPLLICPLAAAWVVRHIAPKLHRRCAEARDAGFYLWALSLMIAIAVTTKAIVHEQTQLWFQLGIAVIALISCLLQFGLGRWMGRRYGECTEGGQALGQKNTVFIIWMGYTFLSPITTLAGGFYCVWQTFVNSYQLYRKARQEGVEREL